MPRQTKKTTAESKQARCARAAREKSAPIHATDEYLHRVYAGVLGKIIGVYLGRPFEGWPHQKILAELGEINYYVHEKLGKPLIVADDDISGTFTFIRALEDYGANRGITAADIGQTWLNYIIENRSILWWGGMGTSTEHTAFLRLKHGMRAPHTGSIAANGKVVAEQIGSQIFIDGWAMVAPGDPELAASLALRAASVSHDGEAIYGAQIIAVMESLAFIEKNLAKILDAAVKFIPDDSVIFRMIRDLRDFHAAEPNDWRKAFAEVLEKNYGYDKFSGGCHMVPNHGVIILALLYGKDHFQRSLMIANTCGWDTDCNSANVGCFMGIKNGLKGIDAGPDWRGPIADRLYLPTADPGCCITDAATQAYRIANIGRALFNEPPYIPDDNARFHFTLPGSVQGFVADQSPECSGVVSEIFNTGQSLAVVVKYLAPGRLARVGVATFPAPDVIKTPGYEMMASPTIYPGQRTRASVALQSDIDLTARLYWKHPGENGRTVCLRGPEVALTESHRILDWVTPFSASQPITEVGIEFQSTTSVSGVVNIKYLTWDGEPDVVFQKPTIPGESWKQAWANGVTAFQEAAQPTPDQQLILIQNEGRGLVIQGTRQWRNYQISTALTPHLAKSSGIAARVQGMQRYYALLLGSDNKLRVVKALDGEHVLASADLPMELDRTCQIAISVEGTRIRGSINGETLLDVNDYQQPLTEGAIGLVCEEGRVVFGTVTVKPA